MKYHSYTEGIVTMKQTASAQKTPQASTNSPAPALPAGPEGAALAPPAYGMGMVDTPVAQRQVEPAGLVPQPNRTGLPDALKAGAERLSGLALDDVRVHYNSAKPAQLQALAYTQGTHIHVAMGQERHLPHEAWHVVQQKQGRVHPTMQAQGIPINDDAGLEAEADRMGGALTPSHSRSRPKRCQSAYLWPGRSAMAAIRSLPKTVQKAKKEPHKTRKGNVKQSTLEWITDAPKGTTASEIIGMWESVKNIFDSFAVADTSPLPPGAAAPTHAHGRPPMMNLQTLQGKYYNFFKPFVDALQPNILGDRGTHGNGENKLPIYPAPQPYGEYSYFKGGGRLVEDTQSGRRYISLHYSRFYRVT
jgi:hypothetical protein